MKRLLLLSLTLICIKSNGQCGLEHSSASYHNSKFVTPEGDTLNSLDSSGFYEGLHLYADNSKNIFDNTHSYTLGYFHHGLPVGDWTDHCSDGSFSVGQFTWGWEVSSDGKGGWIDKKQGIYNKIGVWKYFDRDSNLIKTMRYDRYVKRDETYLQNISGNFILIKYEFNDMHNSSSPFKKEITKEFTEDGNISTLDFENFWKDISLEYYADGQVKEKFKCRKFIGIRINRSIRISYSQDGKVIKKERGKCWTKRFGLMF
ncbi:MAG TPA: hypothetical protein VE978_05685 [Chitinophagales bacterium]|nr:hypothetical protein [Chitinophagales bacterium]